MESCGTVSSVDEINQSVEVLEDAGQVFSEAEMQALHTICFLEDSVLQNRYTVLKQEFASMRLFTGVTKELEIDPALPVSYIRSMMVNFWKSTRKRDGAGEFSYSTRAMKCKRCNGTDHAGPWDAKCPHHDPNRAKSKTAKGDDVDKVKKPDNAFWKNVSKPNHVVDKFVYVELKKDAAQGHCKGCGKKDTQLSGCSNEVCKGKHKQLQWNIANKNSDRSHWTQEDNTDQDSEEKSVHFRDQEDHSEEQSFSSQDFSGCVYAANDCHMVGHKKEPDEVLLDNCSTVNVTGYVADILPGTLEKIIEQDNGIKTLHPTRVKATYRGTARYWTKCLQGRSRYIDVPKTKVVPGADVRIISLDRR